MATINAIGNATYTLVSDGEIESVAGDFSALSGNMLVESATTEGNVMLHRTSSDTDSSHLIMRKSRSGGIISTNDLLGQVLFSGHDGTSPVLSGRILSTCNSAPALNRIPSNLFIYRTSLGGSNLQSVEIKNTGCFKIHTPTVGTALLANDDVHIAGSVTATLHSEAAALFLTGDPGGTASTVTLTNDNNFDVNGAGTFTIKSKSAGALNSSGFVKIYVEGTPYYIPAFSSTSP